MMHQPVTYPGTPIFVWHIVKTVNNKPWYFVRMESSGGRCWTRIRDKGKKWCGLPAVKDYMEQYFNENEVALVGRMIRI